jgi:hypothetical protein
MMWFTKNNQEEPMEEPWQVSPEWQPPEIANVNTPKI